jgi:hypothetical protein
MKFNKPLKIVAAVFSSVIAVIISIVVYFIVQELIKGKFRHYEDFVAFSGIFLALLIFVFSMLPIHTVIKRFIDKSKSSLLQKISPFYLTVISVIRTQVVIAFFFIALATVPKWSDAMQYIVPVPVSEKQMKDWEKMISMGQSSTVYNNVTRLTNYSKRVNMVRLGIRNLKSVYEHAKSNNTLVNMDDLNFFSIIDSLRQINSGEYSKSTLSKFISSDELFKLLSSIAIYGESGGSNDISNDLIAIITNIKPDSPDLLQIQGDILWKRGDVCAARGIYKQYAESIRTTNNLATIPQHIQDIIDIKDKWNITFAPLITQSWVESSPYSFSGLSADGSELLTLGNRKYGSYNSDPVNIYHSTTLENYLRLFIPDCKSTSIDIWKHISSFKPGTYDEELQFTKVNPSFISWVQDNMIPSPSTKFANITFQSLYNKSFRNIARTYKMAHRYVTLNGIDGLASSYSSSYGSEGYNYLLKTFGNITFKESQTNGYMTSLIIGFWLRRYLDNSESSVVALMDYILLKYDRSFLNKIDSEEDYNTFTTFSEMDESSDEEHDYGNEEEENGE